MSEAPQRISIYALEGTWDYGGFEFAQGDELGKVEYVRADRIEELEERLRAAQDDAKEAEAYAGELEAVLESIKAKLATCEKYRDAYAECDRIGTQAVRDLEAKLAKALEALKFYAEADNYEDQHKPESCGCCYYLHDAEIKEDQGAKARTTIAELTGGKDD